MDGYDSWKLQTPDRFDGPAPGTCRCGSGERAYWIYDGRGIELAKVCVECEDEVKKRYRPEILSGYTQEDVDEPIDPED